MKQNSFQKWRHDMLLAWAAFVSRRPWLILGVAIALAMASVGITLAWLQFNPNRNDLISPELDWNKRFIAWQSHFPGASDLIIVVEPKTDSPADHASAQAMVTQLGQRLEAEEDHIQRVLWGFDATAFSPRTARLLPDRAFEEVLDEVRQSSMLMNSQSLEELVRQSLDQARQQSGQQPAEATQPASDSPEATAQIVTQIQQLDAIFGVVHHILQRPADTPVDFGQQLMQRTDALAAATTKSTTQPVAQPIAQPGWQYLTSANSHLYFLRVTPRLQEGSLNAFAPAITEIRTLLDELAPDYPNVDAGLTGIDVVESDETDAASWDSTWTAAVAALLITILLVTAFHSWRLPLLAMASLIVAIACAFGFLTLAIGHLQVLSVVFTLILLGLGIDYAIHLATTFELMRHDDPDTIEGFTQTLARTLGKAGPGLITGSMTTAVAFGTTLFTDFTGVAEMGAVAAAGIVLCLLAMFSVFPALLRIFKHSHKHVVKMEDRRIHFFEEHWVRPFWRRPWVTLGVGGCLLVLSLISLLGMRFDYDLLKLQPRGVDSVLWQQRIVERGNESIWFGVSVVDDLEEARKLAAEYRKQPLVADKLGGVGLLFPPDEEAQLLALSEVRQSLQPGLSQAMEADQSPASGAGLSVQMAVLRQTLPALMAREMPQPIHQAMRDLQQTLDDTTELARSLPPDQLAARLAKVEAGYTQFRIETARQLDVLTDGQPLSMNDVPPSLLESYISDEGKLALEVYPVLPADKPEIQGPLDPRFLPQFVKAITTVDPEVTGVIVQIFRSGYLIKTAYQLAGVAAFFAVLILVWLDFRSLYDAVLTLVPVAVGFGITFGVMWLVGMQINPANIIVLPLMFGIGVDAGVHMLHRYHQQPTQRPLGLTSGTGKGISLTSYTTMIGFGVMMLASHRGIASLGFVLFTGIGMTLLACWIILPCLLELRQRRRERNATSPAVNASH